MRKTVLLIIPACIVLLINFLIQTQRTNNVLTHRNSIKQRIISLTPATTEILFSLGLDEEIIGVTTFCDYPPQALSKEKIGSYSRPSIEKIVSLKPDLILATDLEQAETVATLKKLKLNVHVSSPASFEELYSSIKEIGGLTHREKQANLLINQIQARIDKVMQIHYQIPQKRKPKVFIEICRNPLMTVGPGSFVDELIEIAGGRNIAYDIPRPYSSFSVEHVIKRNPDCIILAYMSKDNSQEMVSQRTGWRRINAVTNNRVYANINSELFLRSGPRLVNGLEELNKRLYPSEKPS